MKQLVYGHVHLDYITPGSLVFREYPDDSYGLAGPTHSSPRPARRLIGPNDEGRANESAAFGPPCDPRKR